MADVLTEINFNFLTEPKPELPLNIDFIKWNGSTFYVFRGVYSVPV